MDAALFRQFCEIAYARAGITLGPGKESLVESRIGKRLRALGLASARDYLEHLRADDGGDELVQFLDVISTNFTSFLREPDHFELFAALVQRRVEEGRDELRVWSAAASTGEEPYSIAITALDAMADGRCGLRILATDISTRALGAARRGEYDAARLEKLTRQQKLRHFERGRDAAGGETWTVRASVRDRIVFQRLNLAAPPFPMGGPFDVVFCRNVMIYFDTRVRQRLVAEIERLLMPSGLLLIGHAETLTGLDTGLLAVRPSVYVKPPAAQWLGARARGRATADRPGAVAGPEPATTGSAK